jgi:hypothetical protein
MFNSFTVFNSPWSNAPNVRCERLILADVATSTRIAKAKYTIHIHDPSWLHVDGPALPSDVRCPNATALAAI